MAKAGSTEKVVREIRRHTRRRFSAEEKIRIVLEGLRGEESIAALCRREGLAPNIYYRWSKSVKSSTVVHCRSLRSINNSLIIIYCLLSAPYADHRHPVTSPSFSFIMR